MTLVNLVPAVFNTLSGLPLDGGYALATLMIQVAGNCGFGLTVTGRDRLAVVGGTVWWWILRFPTLDGHQPDAFNLTLVVMVDWSIVASSRQVLEFGGGARAVSKLDLCELTRPLCIVRPETSVSQVCKALVQGVTFTLVTDGSGLVGTVDTAALRELGLSDVAGSTPTLGVNARQIRTVPPAAAVTTDLTDQGATDAMK